MIPNKQQIIKRAIKDDPERTVSAAEKYFSQGRYLEALRLFEVLIRQDLMSSTLWMNYGNTLLKLKRFEQGLIFIQRAIAINPKNFEAHFSRGKLYFQQKKFELALSSFNFAISLGMQTSELYVAKARSLFFLSRFNEAISCCNFCSSQWPDDSPSHEFLGQMFYAMNRFDDALEELNCAISIEPKAKMAVLVRALTWLALEEYEKGWAAYESRWDCALPQQIRHFKKPCWDGKVAINDKVIYVYGEAGLGDTVQFARFILNLLSLGGQVILEVPQALVGLLSSLSAKPRLTVLTRDQQSSENFDFQCAIMSLPHLLGLKDAGSLRPQRSYLTADPKKVAAWKARIFNSRGLKKIGLVFSGNQSSELDLDPCRRRPMPLSTLGPLLMLSFEFHCLQKEISDADRAFGGAFRNLHFHDQALTDFAETAALIDQMDFVISIDTSVAHVAGALGKELWMMLPNHSDYRWTPGMQETPWYPTAKLFRQSSPGDWSGVINQVLHQLLNR